MIVHMDGVDVSHPIAKRLAAAALSHHSEQLPHAMAAREATRHELAAERRALFREHRVRAAANSCMPAEHEEEPARELSRTKNKIIWRQRAAEQARKNELQRIRNRYVGCTRRLSQRGQHPELAAPHRRGVPVRLRLPSTLSLPAIPAHTHAQSALLWRNSREGGS